MTIRFLEPVESGVPDLPFLPGQIIRVATMDARMRLAVEAGQAVLVPEEPELATVGADERAVKPRGRRR